MESGLHGRWKMEIEWLIEQIIFNVIGLGIPSLFPLWLLPHLAIGTWDVRIQALFSQFCWKKKKGEPHSYFFSLSGLFKTWVWTDALPKPLLVHLHTVKGNSEVFAVLHSEDSDRTMQKNVTGVQLQCLLSLRPEIGFKVISEMKLVSYCCYTT